MNLLNNYANNTISYVSKTNVKNNTNINSKQEYKPDILDIFSEKVVNRRDITDTVTVPRSIFKGYMCFTAGTALNLIASKMKQTDLAKYLGIAGSLISICGTYNFVKSFLIKGNKD